MGQSIVRFDDGKAIRFGVVDHDEIFAVEGTFQTLGDLLSTRMETGLIPTKTKYSFGEVQLLSPITAPAQIVCQGANYSNHRHEAGMEATRPPFNLIFTKSYTSLTGPYDDVIKPSQVRLLDYEIEVGLVITAPLTVPTTITQENMLDYAAGLVIANDISARDIQLVEGQWFKGKSYRTFCPAGPFLYLLDKNEASLIHDLDLKLSVNGEVRQSANTGQLLFKPEETLTELSEMIELFPGDVILTGTPGGVALKLEKEDMAFISNPTTAAEDRFDRLMATQQDKAYLQEGDEIESQVRSADGRIYLGVQRNKVVFEEE